MQEPRTTPKHSIGRKPVAGQAPPASNGQSPSPSTPEDPKKKDEAKKKKVGFRVESDSDTSGSEAMNTINEDEYGAPYAGKWKKVQKGPKTNSRAAATINSDQIRPFGRLVPNWP